MEKNNENTNVINALNLVNSLNSNLFGSYIYKDKDLVSQFSQFNFEFNHFNQFSQFSQFSHIIKLKKLYEDKKENELMFYLLQNQYNNTQLTELIYGDKEKKNNTSMLISSNQLVEREYIKVIKSNKYKIYSITFKGGIYLLEILAVWVQKKLDEMALLEAQKQKLENSNQVIERWQEFFETYYKNEINDLIKTTGYKRLIINFNDLSSFNLELAEKLLDNPTETLEEGEIAIKTNNDDVIIKLGVDELPKLNKLDINEIRSEHLNKIYEFEGIVSLKSPVRPQVTSARFECPSCGNILPILQIDNKFKEPLNCGCGRKGKFKLLSKELVDAQGLVLDENPAFLKSGQQPQSINVFLSNDLCNSKFNDATGLGHEVKIVCIVKEVPIFLRTGRQSTKFDLMLEALYLKPLNQNLLNYNLTKEEIVEIQTISKDKDLLNKLINDFAIGIHGHKEIKKAILLQSVGGVRVDNKAGGKNFRDNIHILIVGDPSTGKSELGREASDILPKVRWASGTGVSSAGLTISAIRDKLTGKWSPHAGAMVLANDGLLIIDEMDKILPDIINSLHTGMEQQMVTLDKAGIHAKFPTKTSILAFANPKESRFDPYKSISKQITFIPTLLSRFDLIFVVRDIQNKENDEALASHILDHCVYQDESENLISNDLLKKYLLYVKSNIQPKVSRLVMDKIKEVYVSLRSTKNEDDPIPIAPRQLEGLIRLVQASAKLHLREETILEDFNIAYDLFLFSLKQVGIDPETGKIDVDRIIGGTTASERNKKKIILENLDKLLAKSNTQFIGIEDLKRKCNFDKDEVFEECFVSLKRSGDVHEPKKGMVGVI